jgi:hypothetical protein
MVSFKKPKIAGMASGKPNMRPADIPDALDGGMGRIQPMNKGSLPRVTLPKQMGSPARVRGMMGKLPRRIK